VIGGFLLGIKLHLQMNSRDKGYNSSSGSEWEKRKRLISLSLSLSAALSRTHSYALFCLFPLHIHLLPVLCICFTLYTNHLQTGERRFFVSSVPRSGLWYVAEKKCWWGMRAKEEYKTMKGLDNVRCLGMKAGIILKWTTQMCVFGVRTGII
jgi:hypothetical protein